MAIDFGLVPAYSGNAARTRRFDTPVQPEFSTWRAKAATDSLAGSGGSRRLATYSIPDEPLDAAHRKWSSVGDPHISIGNEHFEDQLAGRFTLLESEDGFEVQAQQDHPDGNDKVTFNTAVAIRDGGNVVSYDARTHRLSVNGEGWDGSGELPGGTRIEKIGDGFKITTRHGDVTAVHDRGSYLDLDGKLASDRRTGDVRGAFGVFDNTDDRLSHLKRDGSVAASTDDLVADWRVAPEDDLFEAQAGKGGPESQGLLAVIAGLLGLITRIMAQIARLLGLGEPPAPQVGRPARTGALG